MDVLVLCYHAVSESWPAALSIVPDRLERQLGILKRRGYRGSTFSDALGAPRSDRTLVLTFDDAYLSVIDLALPILDRHGFPGTVFAPTAFVGGGEPMAWDGIDRWLDGPHRSELKPMNWENLQTLIDAGWEIGSHTRTHPHLTQLNDAALAAELTGSREDYERALGTRCRSLAYPYGDHDERVVTAAGAAGYEFAATLPSRLHDSIPLRWPRIGIYNADSDTSFRLKVSPTVRRVRGSPIADVAYGLRAWAQDKRTAASSHEFG